MTRRGETPCRLSSLVRLNLQKFFQSAKTGFLFLEIAPRLQIHLAQMDTSPRAPVFFSFYLLSPDLLINVFRRPNSS